jgi:hypothetical protein
MLMLTDVYLARNLAHLEGESMQCRTKAGSPEGIPSSCG